MSEQIIDPKFEERLVVTLDQAEYDLSNCEELAKALEPTYDASTAIVDMTRVEYLDSTCLSKFLVMRKKRSDAGFPPSRLVITSRMIRRLFEVTGFDKIWPVFDSLQAALDAEESVEPPQPQGGRSTNATN